MLQLVPMKEKEFDEYIEISLHEFKLEQIKAGNWAVEGADQRAQKLFQDLLPNGLITPGHFFYHLLNETQRVGVLWIADYQQNNKHMLFVYDIRVFPEFRRQGFATQAIQHVESIALERDIPFLGLYVFEQNQPARALYEKLGFVEEGSIMIKELQRRSNVQTQ